MKKLDRNVESTVSDAIIDIANESRNGELTSAAWSKFYDMICIAYQQTDENRPSVSQLALYLSRLGLKSASKLSVIYAHCLYVLARKQGLAIHANGFNP